MAVAGSRVVTGRGFACGVVEEWPSLGACRTVRSQQGSQWEDAKRREQARGMLMGMRSPCGICITFLGEAVELAALWTASLC